jgi:hypothetical protein
MTTEESGRQPAALAGCSDDSWRYKIGHRRKTCPTRTGKRLISMSLQRTLIERPPNTMKKGKTNWETDIWRGLWSTPITLTNLQKKPTDRVS